MNKNNFAPFIKKLFEGQPEAEATFSEIKNIYGGEDAVYEALRSYAYDGVSGKVPMSEILSVNPEEIHPNYFGYFRQSIMRYLVRRLHNSGETIPAELEKYLPEQYREKTLEDHYKPEILYCAGTELHEI